MYLIWQSLQDKIAQFTLDSSLKELSSSEDGSHIFEVILYKVIMMQNCAFCLIYWREVKANFPKSIGDWSTDWNGGRAFRKAI